jgi:hypothetical protein
VNLVSPPPPPPAKTNEQPRRSVRGQRHRHRAGIPAVGMGFLGGCGALSHLGLPCRRLQGRWPSSPWTLARITAKALALGPREYEISTGRAALVGGFWYQKANRAAKFIRKKVRCNSRDRDHHRKPMSQ